MADTVPPQPPTPDGPAGPGAPPAPLVRRAADARARRGTGKEMSDGWAAARAARRRGCGGARRWDTETPNGQTRRKLAVSRAEELFGFRAHTTLRAGLEPTIDWFRSHRPAEAKAK